MQSESRKARNLLPFFLVFSLEFIINNLAHPVTPAIIKNLHLGDYMFGLAFASMAVTNFLFSPFWGKISRRMRTSTAMALSSAGKLRVSVYSGHWAVIRMSSAPSHLGRA